MTSIFRRAGRCSVSGCPDLAHAFSYCYSHYGRWRRHGDPEAGRPPVRKDWLLARPEATTGQAFTTIPVARGRVQVVVDVEDYTWLAARKWKLAGGRYAALNYRGRIHYMHRLIIGAAHGQNVDHVNGNVLDNRRANLRFATQQQNIHNAAGRKRGTSKYKGVSFSRQCGWQAQIVSSGQYHHLGYFLDETAAARAYNAAARELFGEYAYINSGVE